MTRLRSLSKAARDARKPLPPEVLAGARQETVHVESGKWRVPKSTKVRAVVHYITMANVLACGRRRYAGGHTTIGREAVTCRECLRAMQAAKRLEVKR